MQLSTDWSRRSIGNWPREWAAAWPDANLISSPGQSTSTDFHNCQISTKGENGPVHFFRGTSMDLQFLRKRASFKLCRGWGSWHFLGISSLWKNLVTKYRNFCWSLLNFLDISKGASQKKIQDFLGVFPKCWTPPPPPPIWEASVQKKKLGLFCVLGPKEHFWFLQKCSLFVSILTYTFGNRGPPPPSRKNSQIISFLPIFFQI